MDRRDFLRRTAIGAAALAAVTPPALASRSPALPAALASSRASGLVVDATSLNAKQWEPPASAQVMVIEGEFQRLEIEASGGTFQLILDGETTQAIDCHASPAAVQAAIEGLSSIESVSVEPTKGEGYTISFPSPKIWKPVFRRRAA